MSISTIIIVTPIAVFSIISIAIVLERFLFINKNSISLQKYNSIIEKSFADFKETARTKEPCNVFDKFLSNMFRKTFRSKDELREYIDSNFANISLQYNKRIYLLGIFAKLSTLLGLLGTVVGMISAFNNIVEKGISNAGIVASGISTALLTTAIGLIVAIPTTFFYEYFMGRIENELKKMEIITSNMLSSLYAGITKN